MGRLITPPSRLAPQPSESEAARHRDRQRLDQQPWRRWYNLALWRRRRAAQLAREPLCAYCRAEGRAAAATVADHKEPHRGDWEKFIGGALQSLCHSCHSSVKQTEESAPPWQGG
jgi:5-methylcytosine-specific restriction protein A